MFAWVDGFYVDIKILIALVLMLKVLSIWKVSMVAYIISMGSLKMLGILNIIVKFSYA